MAALTEGTAEAPNGNRYDPRYHFLFELADGVITRLWEFNDTFHTLIHSVADNEWLARAITEINQAFPRNVSWLVLAGNRRQREENVAEHDRIVDALEAGDAATARAEMRAHVKNAGEQLARWYEDRSATVFVG